MERVVWVITTCCTISNGLVGHTSQPFALTSAIFFLVLVVFWRFVGKLQKSRVTIIEIVQYMVRTFECQYPYRITIDIRERKKSNYQVMLCKSSYKVFNSQNFRSPGPSNYHNQFHATHSSLYGVSKT